MDKNRRIIMKSVFHFKDKFGFLSNFYLCTLTYKGHSWKTVEHAFQAAKTFDPCEREAIKNARYPAYAKKLGNEIQKREDWGQIKIGVMTELIWLKFEQNPELRKQLIDTGSAKLIEGNYWHDNTYGDCFCRNCISIPGRNILGIILMKVRKMICQNKIT